MTFLDLAKERYAVRKFSDRKVEAEKIEYILEAARVAPTARNFQPLRIYVMESEEAIAMANECTECIYGAQLVFAICYDKDAMAHVDGNDLNFGIMDASIVMTHMIMAAQEQGLGTCWVGAYDDAVSREKLQLAPNMEMAGFLPVGYAEAGPSERHGKRKPLEELIVRL